MQVKNYLSNRELLREIHKSKMSFCYMKDKRYYDYDIIIDDIANLNSDILEEAKKNRAKRISYTRWEDAIAEWEKSGGKKSNKPKLADNEIPLDEINLSDIVIRTMTFDHIPLDDRKATPKTTADKHIRCNFPPFKHYALVDNNWEEVVRSHWKGTIEDGEFTLTKGKMTNKLGSMMIKLVERFSTKGNWRGYSYVDEMRGNSLVQLIQFGLYFDESKGNNPFAYFTTTITNSFTGYLNSEKKNQNIRDDLLQDAGYMPSYTRQFNDELAQKIARDDYMEKFEQDQKDSGINL